MIKIIIQLILAMHNGLIETFLVVFRLYRQNTDKGEFIIMKKSVFAIMACTVVVAFAACGIDNTDGAVSSGGNELERIVERNMTEKRDVSEIQEPLEEVAELNANVDDISTDKDINIVWSRTYYWAMGSDYVYVEPDGRIYSEGEMENPTWSPSGACEETYTGQQFAEEELKEFLSINIDDEDGQKEVLRKKGIKFGDRRR